MSRLRQWLAGDRPAAPRLTAQQAVDLARAAAASHALAHTLRLATLRTDAGRLVWDVGSDGIGRTLLVTLADATGEVLSIRELGLR